MPMAREAHDFFLFQMKNKKDFELDKFKSKKDFGAQFDCKKNPLWTKLNKYSFTLKQKQKKTNWIMFNNYRNIYYVYSKPPPPRTFAKYQNHHQPHTPWTSINHPYFQTTVNPLIFVTFTPSCNLNQTYK